jgi:hypothetical protein
VTCSDWGLDVVHQFRTGPFHWLRLPRWCRKRLQPTEEGRGEGRRGQPLPSLYTPTRAMARHGAPGDRATQRRDTQWQLTSPTQISNIEECGRQSPRSRLAPPDASALHQHRGRCTVTNPRVPPHHLRSSAHELESQSPSLSHNESRHIHSRRLRVGPMPGPTPPRSSRTHTNQPQSAHPSPTSIQHNEHPPSTSRTNIQPPLRSFRDPHAHER